MSEYVEGLRQQIRDSVQEELTDRISRMHEELRRYVPAPESMPETEATTFCHEHGHCVPAPDHPMSKVQKTQVIYAFLRLWKESIYETEQVDGLIEAAEKDADKAWEEFEEWAKDE